MPRGGARPGGGRPVGSKDGYKRVRSPNAITLEPHRRAESPLQYLLDVMGDATVDPVRRDRAAVAAAQYLHRKADDAGKKVLAAEEAKTAHIGTPWEKLLERNNRVAVSGPAGDGIYKYPGTADDDDE
jgi:hypothetical protein